MNRLCVGKIVRPQGVKGEVKVEPYTDDAARFEQLKTCFIEQSEAAVESVRLDNGSVYIKFSGINDRNAAESLRNSMVYVDRADAVPLEEGRYFIADLIGCGVFSDGGERLGTLEDVLQNGAADVYVVKGERDFMVPALKRLLTEVDVENRRIVLDSQALSETAVYGDED